jgi:hypothetical protein
MIGHEIIYIIIQFYIRYKSVGAGLCKRLTIDPRNLNQTRPTPLECLG